ncbi:hypothetical protein ACJJI3_21445 [Microbulbifer sp. ZKSA004]|uniref:hypothetical protein n=1 Tax=Microbulbifer sp. ZKSA004 TaxID=3243389 RepID=UPI004039B5BC
MKNFKFIVIVLFSIFSAGCSLEVNDEDVLYQGYMRNLDLVYDYYKLTAGQREADSILINYLIGVGTLSMAVVNDMKVSPRENRFLCISDRRIHEIKDDLKVRLQKKELDPFLKSTLKSSREIIDEIKNEFNLECESKLKQFRDNLQG